MPALFKKPRREKRKRRRKGRGKRRARRKKMRPMITGIDIEKRGERERVRRKSAMMMMIAIEDLLLFFFSFLLCWRDRYDASSVLPLIACKESIDVFSAMCTSLKLSCIYTHQRWVAKGRDRKVEETNRKHVSSDVQMTVVAKADLNWLLPPSLTTHMLWLVVMGARAHKKSVCWIFLLLGYCYSSSSRNSFLSFTL